MGESSGRTESQQKQGLSQQFPSTDWRYVSVLAALCTSMTSLNIAAASLSGFILQNVFAVCVRCSDSGSSEAGWWRVGHQSSVRCARVLSPLSLLALWTGNFLAGTQ